MNRKIQVQIDRVKEVIVQKLNNKGLICLYLAGEVPSKEQITSSDTDISE